MRLLKIPKVEVMLKVDLVQILTNPLTVDKWSILVKEENFRCLHLLYRRVGLPLLSLNDLMEGSMVPIQIRRGLLSISKELETSATLIMKEKLIQQT